MPNPPFRPTPSLCLLTAAALHAAATGGATVAYGRHGQIQIFEGQEPHYAEAREGFERVLSFEPRSLFFLIETVDAFHYVRAGRC